MLFKKQLLQNVITLQLLHLKAKKKKSFKGYYKINN